MTTSYSELEVWDDESGERYFIVGHVNRRRALAAVNRYVRQSCGLGDRADQLGDVAAGDVGVSHIWVGDDPQHPRDPEAGVLSGPHDPSAVAITEVYL